MSTMIAALRTVNRILVNAGFDARRMLTATREVSRYLADYYRFSRLQRRAVDGFHLLLPHPCFGDHEAGGGTARGHYFHQDLLVARRIYAAAPRRHIDVGSRIDGFVAHVASYRPITICDLRPVSERIPNVTFHQVDLMATLPADLRGCCDSLSCLHALEHFGLGRYGDALRCDGYLLGLDNLRRMLEPRGLLYLSVPIGPQRIEFNAHRVFAVSYLLDILHPRFDIECFSFVDDAGILHETTTLEGAGVRSNFGCTYGCAIFELRRAPDVSPGPRR